MDKKGQGLSINTIVVSAIAVVVLVVIILVFTGKIGVFNHTASDCVKNSGTCVKDEVSCTSTGGRVMSYSCDDTKNPICCLKVPEK